MYEYEPLSKAISRYSREQILAFFPVTQGDHPEAVGNRRFLQAFLSMEWMDRDSDGLVMPFERVAFLAEKHPKSPGFSAREELERVSRELIPLKVQGPCRDKGRATVVWPSIPLEVEAIWRMEVPERPRLHLPRVDFVTGEPLSQRERIRQLGEYEQWLRAKVLAPDSHAGLALLHILNNQPGHALHRLCHANWAGACVELDRLPRSNAKLLSIDVMRHLAEQQILVYSAVENSHRLFAKGTNLIQLDRKVRSALLRGAWQHDLVNAQFAIAARIWEIPELLAFLEDDGCSIWAALLQDLDLGPDYKPTIKTQLYRLTFGGSVYKAMVGAQSGSGGDPGMTREKAKLLLAHPLIRALVTARNRIMWKIRADGGVEDAFGFWHPLTGESGKEIAKRCRSLMAMQAQSYELRIMLGVVPALRAEQQSIRPVVWLHDGMITKATNMSKQKRIHERLARDVQRAADELRIPTRLVSEKL